MATDNKSPSYLKQRDKARKWLTGKSRAGQYARDQIIRQTPGQDAAAILDDDDFVDWEELVNDHRDDLMVASSCREAREAFDLAKQARSTLGPPGANKDRWIRFMSTPLYYVLRRQIETGDPDYWKDPANQLREAMAHPEWCCVPLSSIRDHLAQYLPKGELVAGPKADKLQAFAGEPEPEADSE